MASSISAAAKAQPVRVFLRARPLGAAEAVDAAAATSDGLTVNSSHAVMRGKTFHFDACFGSNASQPDVYTVVGPPLLESATSGLNATLLAYGQSGSGKTHTMFGDAVNGVRGDNMGVVPRLLDDLFETVRREQSEHLSKPNAASADNEDGEEAVVSSPTFVAAVPKPIVTYRISARMFEVYNEHAFDMLAPSRAGQLVEVRVRDNSVIDGITEPIVTSAEAALALLESGMARRTSGATNRNERSSRSHAVFQLRVRREAIIGMPPAPTTTDSGAGGKTSKDAAPVTRTTTMSSLLSLVDLAGSERYVDAATGGKDEAERLKQMVKINLSLGTLRRVIQALADNATAAPGAAPQLPPYRDSLLTRALTAAFGGNSSTAVVVTVSPNPANANDTFSSLQFGSIVRRVVNKTTANVDTKDRLITAMSDEISALKATLAAREAELASKHHLLEEAQSTLKSVHSSANLQELLSRTKYGVEVTTVSVQTDVQGPIAPAASAAETAAAEAEAAVLIGELRQQVVRLEVLRDETEADKRDDEAMRRQLLDDIAAKDVKILQLIRAAADEKRARHRAIDKMISSRKDIVEAMEAIKAPLLKTPGCPLCLNYAVEESTQAKALVRALAELHEANTALGEAQEDAARYQSQVRDLSRDLLTMQNKLNASASLQRRCDEQQMLLDMREEQIAKYLAELAQSQMECFRLRATFQQQQQQQQHQE